jgi:hypothetical protein
VNGCVRIKKNSLKKWIFHLKFNSHPWRSHSKWLTLCQNQKSAGKSTGLADSSTGTTLSSPGSLEPEEKLATDDCIKDGGGEKTQVL